MGNVKLLYMVFISLFFYVALPAYEYQLSICAIFQNEARFLKEWINYHQKVGVEHFWLYNNNSDDNYLEVLQPYINNGIVELKEWNFSYVGGNDFFYRVQIGAYNDCLNLAKGKSKWLAIIDSDEFIMPISDKNISNILNEKFSSFGGVVINWQCFGTSNIERCPEDKLLPFLKLKMPQNHELNHHYKSIVYVEKILDCMSPHCCNYISPFYHVNTKYEIPGNLTNEVNIDILRINHYWTRDEEFFKNVKVPRYLKWNKSIEGVMKQAEEMNSEYDDEIINLL